MWLPVGIQEPQKIDSILKKKLAKKRFECIGSSIWNANICLQQGNGPTSGGPSLYQNASYFSIGCQI